MPGVCTEIEGISKAAVVPPPSIVFCKLPPRCSTKTSLLVYLAAAAMTCSRSSSNSLILLVDSANCLSFCASFSCASASICLILACATVSSFFSCFSLASAASACGDVQKVRVRVRRGVSVSGHNGGEGEDMGRGREGCFWLTLALSVGMISSSRCLICLWSSARSLSRASLSC